MAAQYIALDGTALAVWLSARDFQRDYSSKDEIVYSKRAESNPDLVIKVYTSVSDGALTGRARGKDAIRVCCIRDIPGKAYGVAKTARVHRTTSQESIQARVAERIAECEARAVEWTERQLVQSKARHSEIAERAESVANGTAKTLTLAEMNKSLVQAGIDHTKNYVGVVGYSVRLTLTVKRRMQYGKKFLFVLEDAEKRECVYWSERDVLLVGLSYSIRAVVKKHFVFHGTHQTEIIECVGKRIIPNE